MKRGSREHLQRILRRAIRTRQEIKQLYVCQESFAARNPEFRPVAGQDKLARQIAAFDQVICLIRDELAGRIPPGPITLDLPAD